MPHNIKRNKSIFASIQSEMKRLGFEPNVDDFIKYFVADFVSASTALNVHNQLNSEISPDILDDDSLLIGVLKILGIMESSKNNKEFAKLLKQKGDIKYKGDMDRLKGQTNFDKILSSMLKVPPLKDNKKKKDES